MENKFLYTLREIKSVSMATISSDGLPQVRIIDVMLIEHNSLYFCTARGKDFYAQLIRDQSVSILGMTKDYRTIRLTGKAEHLKEQKKWIDKIFLENPVMNEVYPGESRYILEPFCVSSGTLEYFDLSSSSVYRECSLLGNAGLRPKGYEITDACTACGLCYKKCPQGCIKPGSTYAIQQQHCLHCGLCYEICPVKAVTRRRAGALSG